MDTRFCSTCLKKLSPLFFLRDVFALPSSKVFTTCYVCREKSCIDRALKKRRTLHELDSNIGPPPAKRQTTSAFQIPPLLSILNYGSIQPIQRSPLPEQCPLSIQPLVSPVRSLRPSSIQPSLIQPCSKCLKKLSPLFFLRDAFALPSSKVFATCYICREKDRIDRALRKRHTLYELDPNIGPRLLRQRATSSASP